MTKNSNMGRQKITMEKIAKKNHLQVTFSKRRAGIFKKTSELCTLCGVDVEIIVFSPANKNQCWWQAPIDQLGLNEVEQLRIAFEELKKNVAKQAGKVFVQSDNNHWKFLAVNNEIGVYFNPFENKVNDIILNCTHMAMVVLEEFWCDAPIDNMGVEELEAYVKAMEELRNNVARRANELMGNVFATFTLSNAGDFGNGFADQDGDFGWW
ncbi:hypothetical protein CRYUN_Cryun04dG0014000 [Craigia yunnanensis]